MDQGDAAVWAAGLGIAGTLLGALGGAVVQGRNSRRQVADQERVDIGHWLRGQRQAAYAAVLEQADQVTVTLEPVLVARIQPDFDENGDNSQLWGPANAALRALKQAVTTVAVAGPPEMELRARAVYEAANTKARAMRVHGIPFDDRTVHYAEAGNRLDAARRRFVEAARDVLSGRGA